MKLLLLLLVLVGIGACSATPAHTHKLVPCWLEQPVGDGLIGQNGLARDLFTGGEQPVVTSRKRALASLATYLNLGELSQPELDPKTPAVTLGAHTVYFTDDYRRDGYIHSHARLDSLPADSQQCLPSRCDLEACDPAWLCYPGLNGKSAILGVSYRASSLVEQHDKSIENALLQAEYLYGVNVDVKKRLWTAADNSSQFSILQSNAQLNAVRQKDYSYLITNQCRSGSTLFSRIELKGPALSMPKIPADDLSWLRSPKYLGYDGAVGSVHKRASSGLFSDQIKLAVKRATVQLALEKKTQLREESLNVQHLGGGTLFVSDINEETHVQLKVKVLGLHFEKRDKDLIEVFAWVARVDD